MIADQSLTLSLLFCFDSARIISQYATIVKDYFNIAPKPTNTNALALAVIPKIIPKNGVDAKKSLNKSIIL